MSNGDEFRRARRRRPYSRYLLAGSSVLMLLVLWTPGRAGRLPAMDSVPGGPPSASTTWAADVAPLLYRNCVGCHRPGGSAPFSLLDYDDAAERADRIIRAVRAGRMPPWLPSAEGPALSGERRLDPGEAATLAEWVDTGAPRGDLAEAPAPPAFEGRWTLGEPELIVEFPEYTVPADGQDVYRNVLVRPELDAPVYVRTADLLPGNPQVVHHARFMVDETDGSRTLDAAEPGPGFDGMDAGRSAGSPDGFFIGWTPGRQMDPGRPDLAWRLDPGTDLVLQLHLRPTGREETVRPRLGLYLAGEVPQEQPVVIMLENKTLDIPPNDDTYVARERYRIPVDAEALTIYPHAHYLGRSVRSWADLPDGSRRELLRIDDWDFDWQDQYRFREPVGLPAGSEVVMEWTFDNTSGNPRNPFDPPRRVTFGPESTDEMAELAIQVLPVDPSDRERLVTDLAQFYRGADARWLANDARGRGDRLAAEGRWVEAIEAYREALLEANDPAVLVAMAEAFLGAGDPASAVLVAERASRDLDGSGPRALLTLARAYRAAGRLDEARATARRGLDALGAASRSPLADSLARISGGSE